MDGKFWVLEWSAEAKLGNRRKGIYIYTHTHTINFNNAAYCAAHIKGTVHDRQYSEIFFIEDRLGSFTNGIFIVTMRSLPQTFR